MKMIEAKEEHLELVKSILREFLPSNSKVFVFGSRVTGKAQPYSDLDLVIDAGRELTLNESAKLSDAFEESNLPYKIDCVDWHGLADDFRALIERDKVDLL